MNIAEADQRSARVPMFDVEAGRFVVGVCQDVHWAERGLDALKHHGFSVESLSVMAKESPEAAELIRKVFGGDGARVEVRRIGPMLVRGPLIDAVQGPQRDFSKLGIGAAMGRVGFQAHDGFIYELLTARGGVLVAIRSESRAADALAVLHCHGGGNAAIGAWAGRL